MVGEDFCEVGFDLVGAVHLAAVEAYCVAVGEKEGGHAVGVCVVPAGEECGVEGFYCGVFHRSGGRKNYARVGGLRIF